MSFEEPGVPSYPLSWSNLSSDITKNEKRMSKGQNKIKIEPKKHINVKKRPKFFLIFLTNNVSTLQLRTCP